MKGKHQQNETVSAQVHLLKLSVVWGFTLDSIQSDVLHASHHTHRLKLPKGMGTDLDLASPLIFEQHKVHLSSRASDVFFSEKNSVWTYLQNHSATESTHGKWEQWANSFTNCTAALNGWVNGYTARQCETSFFGRLGNSRIYMKLHIILSAVASSVKPPIWCRN